MIKITFDQIITKDKKRSQEPTTFEKNLISTQNNQFIDHAELKKRVLLTANQMFYILFYLEISN